MITTLADCNDAVVAARTQRGRPLERAAYVAGIATGRGMRPSEWKAGSKMIESGTQRLIDGLRHSG